MVTIATTQAARNLLPFIFAAVVGTLPLLWYDGGRECIDQRAILQFAIVVCVERESFWRAYFSVLQEDEAIISKSETAPKQFNCNHLHTTE
jgi:hypothetical protein